tara:strand:- start:972 stop:1085 length:114 start_codon:yes stop_codon:yes gene_type:complete
MSTLQSLTKLQKAKMALVNTVMVRVSEGVFCATIEWE